ncbi:hypothetical protein [Pseudochryseolinea flava]|uniref:Uncharacterized protein n=1 Tax=Pseudochryseolinea flava TaxID=2059302 RepID=A0A364Y5T6_9BACT|nr:hypothetical protein [Pseudochryseolinea flava]RAW01197.1 hypothetical protein DQQ10_09790 [Pseudochryseolinea flava]
MKKLLSIIGLTVLGAITVNAQSSKTESYPYWTIAKGVQQLQFKDSDYKPSAIVTGNAGWTVSKGVNRSTDARTGSVQTGGRPTWFISKGVARQQAEKSK